MIKPRKLIAGKWKMNSLLEEGRALAGELRRRLDGADHLHLLATGEQIRPRRRGLGPKPRLVSDPFPARAARHC
jgi:hypothetical protein